MQTTNLRLSEVARYYENFLNLRQKNTNTNFHNATSYVPQNEIFTDGIANFLCQSALNLVFLLCFQHNQPSYVSQSLIFNISRVMTIENRPVQCSAMKQIAQSNCDSSNTDFLSFTDTNHRFLFGGITLVSKFVPDLSQSN